MKWKGYGNKRSCPTHEISKYLHGGSDENYEKNTVRTAGVPVEIRTLYLQIQTYSFTATVIIHISLG
jgi:hypothetical protein